MVFKGQTVDGEASFFRKPLQPATNGLHGAKVDGEPGGGTGVRDSPGYKGGQRVQAQG